MGVVNSKRSVSESESHHRSVYRVIDAIRHGNYGYAREKCHELGLYPISHLAVYTHMLEGGSIMEEYLFNQMAMITGSEAKDWKAIVEISPLNGLQTAVRKGDLQAVDTILRQQSPDFNVFDAITEKRRENPHPSALWIASLRDNLDMFLTLLNRMTPYLHKYFYEEENINYIGECISMRRSGSIEMISEVFLLLERENYGQLHDSISAKWVVQCSKGLCGDRVIEYLLQKIPNGDRSIVDLLKLSADHCFTDGRIRKILHKIPNDEFVNFITEYHQSVSYVNFSYTHVSVKGSVLSVTIEHNNLKLMKEITRVLRLIEVCRQQNEKIQIEIRYAAGQMTQEMMGLCHQFIDQDRFYIPSSQDAHLQMHGIVCYNEGEREGANEEASVISKSLASVGVKMSSDIKNWSSHILTSSLKRFCRQVNQNCSLVVVCLMSHGAEGILYGNYSTDDWLEISDVFAILNTGLPEQIPKVVIVQACQGEHMSGSQSEPSTQSDAKVPSGPRVGLRRAHSPYYLRLTGSNIIVLSAAGPGELAIRNHFIPSLTDSIRQADGKRGIYEMLLTAKNRMRHSIGETAACQNPMFMSNAYKKVVLPKPPYPGQKKTDKKPCTIM